MATTVYTYNDKVLKNVATDKWLKKPDAPAGFVMDASNATISNNTANWEGPNYPNEYDGEGKTLQIIVKEEGFTCYGLQLQYASSIGADGPAFVVGGTGIWVNPAGDATASVPVGTYNVSIIHNVGQAGLGYGKYIRFTRVGPVSTLDSALLSKLEFRIID